MKSQGGNQLRETIEGKGRRIEMSNRPQSTKMASKGQMEALTREKTPRFT
jgi:hypothetical protein